MALIKVISGGQSGADQAGWRAARRAGIETGGWMLRGFLTEDGPRPDFAELYSAREHESDEYPPRTRQNALEADLTLWLGPPGSKGYWCTRNAVKAAGKPFMEIAGPAGRPAGDVARDISVFVTRVLNVAGPRESSRPGIGARVERYLFDVFTRLREAERGAPDGP